MILDVSEQGKLVQRQSQCVKGYINNARASKEALTGGYFRTGDQGKKDEDEYVIITGRIRELINRGGERFSPIQLDHVITGFQKCGRLSLLLFLQNCMGRKSEWQLGLELEPT